MIFDCERRCRITPETRFRLTVPITLLFSVIMDFAAGAFNLLKTVSVSGTIWSSVYEQETKTFHVAVGRKYNAVKTFVLKSN